MTECNEHRIKKASPDQAAGIATIERETFSHPWSEAAIRSELEREDSIFLVYTMGTVVCGYVNCRNVCGEGYIGNVAVKQDFRRRGIGKLLLEALKQTATGKDMDFLTLEVRVSNLSAIHLYEVCGYRKVGERKNFYSDPPENALLMTLDLK